MSKQQSKTKLMGSRNRSPQPTRSAVGSTDSCCDAEKVTGKDQACHDFGVTRVLHKVCEGLGASASIVQLVKSLIFVFIARRSQRPQEKWFSSDKEFGRMVNSFRKVTIELMSHENDQNEEQDYLKYHLAVLMCKAMGDEAYPARPAFATRPLFVGWLKRCVLRALARHDLSFIYSLLQTKRAWPKLSETREEMALEDHRQNVCTKRQIAPLTKDLSDEIQATSWDLFKKLPEPTKFMPSGSACMQVPRRKGGATALFLPFRTQNLGRGSGGILGRSRTVNNELNAWRQSEYHHARKECLDCIVNPTWAFDSSSLLNVVVQPIPEPGKFRIITKGDGYLYTALQPAQGQLLSAWKKSKFSTMRFTTLEELDDAVRQMDRNCNEPEWKFMSVDYKSATDLLYKEASDLAILPIIGLFEEALCEFSLSPALVHYPISKNEKGVPDDFETLEQKEGQLMGHPLSFPMLCSLNLAVYRCSIRRWVAQDRSRRSSGNLMWKNVLVNGDDMLFKCPDSFVSVFYSTAAEVGFKISLGKNYVSSHCALINSKLYQRKNGEMSRVGYLNLKLILGISLKDGDSAATPDQLGRDLSEMCARCPWATCCIPLAFSRWSDAWKGWFQPNWFLPRHLGGYGVNPRFSSDELKITRSQRRMATFFIHDPALQLFRKESDVNYANFPIPLKEFAGQLANWKVFASDSENMPETDGLAEVEDTWLERLAYLARAQQMALPPGPDSVKYSQMRKNRQSRLQPLSLKGLMRYWDAIVLASNIPICPPLCVIRGHRVRFKRRMEVRKMTNPYRPRHGRN